MMVILLLSGGAFSVGIVARLQEERSIPAPHSPLDEGMVGKLSRKVEIPAGSDYHIHFSSGNLSLRGKPVVPCTCDLSEKEKDAVARAPLWIQRKLARQFQKIDGESYAELLLNASKRYVDEMAFSIACSPVGDVPSPDVIYTNAVCLYENDEWIQYADIIDYDNGAGDYHSTIRYRVMENGEEKEIECPSDIYYWYVVHPKITFDHPETVYGRFWREYLSDHSDRGYPLLREKLEGIRYLWDCEAYFQGPNRQWRESIEAHPTAIEVISYWIGKTVPAQAVGDRPGQPNIIAHEHNGWCGELQTLAVAAQRTALIPSVSANNRGEDHAWREFYERGWHENDNWWTDSGGAVDEPDVYTYGWGKNMSSVFAWRGDDSIYEVTHRYIHESDRRTVTFSVTDLMGNPVDGARIIVLVPGLLDWSWLKDKLWEATIEKLWSNLPERLRENPFIQHLYQKLCDMYAQVPDVVDSVLPSIWNYTDMKGECTLDLGVNQSCLFLIQRHPMGESWKSLFMKDDNTVIMYHRPGEENVSVIFSCEETENTTEYRIVPSSYTGEYFFNISFATEAYQLQKNILSGGVGEHRIPGSVEFFIVDEENFNRYMEGKSFECYEYGNFGSGNIRFNMSEGDWYVVFRNPARRSTVLLDLSAEVRAEADKDCVQIVAPETSIFEHPRFDCGETIAIEGIATSSVSLEIENEDSHELTPVGGEWFYIWNTSGLGPGTYQITATCGAAEDRLLVTLVDVSPPTVKIDIPSEGDIVNGGTITVKGISSDNVGVEKVEVAINGEWKTASGTHSWEMEWDLAGLPPGDYTVAARAVDASGKQMVDTVHVAINGTGHAWGPSIVDVHHEPDNPTNTSNVCIYANVTERGPFSITHVTLFWDDGIITQSAEMFRYGDNPVQERHEEDPLHNVSNEPIYGKELGEFPSGAHITYWIRATDTANNHVVSAVHSFII